jgi:MFS family permease
MQASLCPIVGRLSDVLDRKWLVSIPPLVAFVGAVVSATANSMSTLIGGGILIGVTLSTISIVQAIPSEILPLKYRAVANGAGFIGSGIGGIVGSLGAGKVTSLSASGWRNIFWMQAALHGATCLGFILLYHPPRRSDYPQLSFRQCFWAIDPVGSGLFMAGTTLALLALDWVNTYSWSDAHVVAPLCIGLISLLAFGAYGKCPGQGPRYL